MAALATLERVWPPHDISYVNICDIVLEMVWKSHHVVAGSLVILGLCDIFHVNHHFFFSMAYMMMIWGGSKSHCFFGYSWESMG